MSEPICQQLARRRAARGWSQEQLAARAGLSRAEISAIETARLVPSTAAALALARALACRVEDLFSLSAAAAAPPAQWAWPPAADPCRFWRARLGPRTLRYPVERTLVGALPADGVAQAGAETLHAEADPEQMLVVAGCDPAVGLLRAELLRATAVQLLPLGRSSCRALELLRRDVVHAAGVHLQDADDSGGNARSVRERLGPGYTLLRVARWQEGLALAPGLNLRTVTQAVNANLRWVGREDGSGARRCLDRILAGHRPLPKGYHHVARDHGGVVETIRSGWAQVGLCVRLAAAEAGLDFLVARREDYDLCYRSDRRDDPRIRALVHAVRSRSFRRALGELPGYDTAETGTVVHVAA